MLAELLEHLAVARGDEAVRVLVISSADHLGLSAGADVTRGARRGGQGAPHAALRRPLRRVVGFPKPTVAACHGDVVGGGAEIAIACDMRVGGANLRLRFPGAALGVPVGPARLVTLCGLATAKYLLLTSRTVGADEALRLGLVNRVAPAAATEAAALELAAAVAAHPPEAVAQLKRMLHEWDDVEGRSAAEGRGQVEQYARQRACRSAEPAFKKTSVILTFSAIRLMLGASCSPTCTATIRRTSSPRSRNGRGGGGAAEPDLGAIDELAKRRPGWLKDCAPRRSTSRRAAQLRRRLAGQPRRARARRRPGGLLGPDGARRRVRLRRALRRGAEDAYFGDILQQLRGVEEDLRRIDPQGERPGGDQRGGPGGDAAAGKVAFMHCVEGGSAPRQGRRGNQGQRRRPWQTEARRLRRPSPTSSGVGVATNAPAIPFLGERLYR